ncbi:hypothetical protein KI387_033229, partial [Taxus chinensis]
MASSSTSTQTNEERHAFSGIQPPGIRRKVDESSKLFDVFINHRGPDVKETLALQFYNSLKDKGLQAFLDSEEKRVGDSFPSTIYTAISSACAHIAIFSKRYAESPWCLEELRRMIESEAKIYPVFYEVKPSDLRYIEKGEYAKAFTEHESKSRYEKELLEQWKAALQKVSFIAGEECNSSSDCKTIVSAVEKEVRRKKSRLHVAKYPVGLDKLVEDFKRKCGMNEKGKEGSQMVGIFGMGGLGKTTLSKHLFNDLLSKYKRSSFLFDVARSELHSLQIKLLKDLFDEDNCSIRSIEDGKRSLQYCLERSSSKNLKEEGNFLIVLDDIDCVQQLDALLIDDILKCGNNLVIVTTRDEGVLKNIGVDAAYNLKRMDRKDATELFCQNAFRQPQPVSEYKDLVDRFIHLCGNLPLSLEVLGSIARGRSVTDWKSRLNEVEQTLPQDIMARLKISFDSLGRNEQEVFMDIACFFVDKSKSLAVKVLDGSGWNAEYAIQTLKEKSLLEEMKYHWSGGLVLRMHDHLRELGREMASQMSGRPPRIWRPQDLKSLQSKGFQTILKEINGRCFHSFLDRDLDAEVTYFVGHSQVWGQPSAPLLWLELNLNGQKHSSIPPWIPLQNLQFLTVHNGHLERLWQSYVQKASSLKELKIFDIDLGELPDLSGISTNLEKVDLSASGMTIERWSSLEILIIYPRSLVVRPSTLSVDPLSKATFKKFSSTVSLSNLRLGEEVALNNSERSPDAEFPMSCLEKLEIFDQNLVAKVLISGKHYAKLESLLLRSMEKLSEVDLQLVTTLKSLQLRDLKNLKSVSGISDLTNVVVLNIYGCPELEEMPHLFHLRCLKIVSIDDCQKLKCLVLDGCTNLKTVEMSDVPNLLQLSIHHCPELEELPLLEGLSCLNSIKIDGCGKLKRLELRKCENLKSLSGNYDLAELEISECPRLEGLPCLGRLQKLTIINCEKLQNKTLPTTLTYLEVGGKELKILPGLSKLTNLLTLIISKCPMLEELSSLAPLKCLAEIIIDRCDKLQNIPGIEELPALKKMRLLQFSNAALIQKSIRSLQTVPSEHMTLIGRAVDGAESVLKPRLFLDLIGGEAVSQIHIEERWRCGASLHSLEIMPKWGSLSAIIVCAAVRVDTATSMEIVLSTRDKHLCELHGGEWIVTVLITDQRLINHYIENPKQIHVVIELESRSVGGQMVK